MVDTVDIELKEHELRKKRPALSKKVNSILRGGNCNIIYFNLTHLKNLPNDIYFDEAMMVKFYNFLKSIKQSNVVSEEFLIGFIKKINTSSIDVLIKCLSFLSYDLDYYREMISYNRIYQIYIKTVKNIFIEPTTIEHLNVLIDLLNNNKLAFKGILPVLKKLNLFLSEKSVEKNLVSCCIVLSSIFMKCPELIKFNSQIISFLVEILQNPNNYIFLEYEDAKIISNCINICINYCSIEGCTKKFTIGLFRECLGVIDQFKSSTVIEEALTVTFMTEILSYIFILNIKNNVSSELLNLLKGKIFDFTFLGNIKLLSFKDYKKQAVINKKTLNENEYFGPVKLEECSKKVELNNLKIKKEVKNEEVKNITEFDIVKINNNDENYNIDIQRKKTTLIDTKSIESSEDNKVEPFLASNLKQYQVIIDHFITAKFSFFDLLYSQFDISFDRVSFFNDLSRMKRPSLLFEKLKSIKKLIDWSDLIVFACNTNQSEYIKLLFDQAYDTLAQKFYMKIFLKSLEPGIKEHRLNLLYFTREVIKKQNLSLLLELYLIGLKRNDMESRQRRRMILNFINKEIVNELQTEKIVIEFPEDSNESEESNLKEEKKNIPNDILVKGDSAIYKDEVRTTTGIGKNRKTEISREFINIPGTSFVEERKYITVRHIINKKDINKQNNKQNDENESKLNSLLDYNTSDIENLLHTELFKFQINEKACEIVKELQNIKEIKYHKNICPLLLILANKRLTEELSCFLFEMIVKMLKTIKREKSEIRLVAIAAIYALSYNIKFYNSKNKIKKYLELVVQFLFIMHNNPDKKYLKIIKTQGFDIIMKGSDLEIQEIKKIIYKKEESKFYKEFLELYGFLRK